jgi:hypothetical protein
MPTARACLSTSAVNGKIYAIGGTLSNPWYRGISTVEEYNPATNTWTKKADMPTGRTNFSTSAVNGKIYAIGGLTEGLGNDLSPVEEYDPVTDTWTMKADMPTARSGLATSTVNGKVYAIGGWIGNNPPASAISTMEEYDTGLTVSSPDFNGDGFVDGADMSIMVDYWHTDNALYDIAPVPWGDGIVDVQDLIFLSESLFEKVNDPTLFAHWALDETEGVTAHDNVNDIDDYVFGGAIWQPAGGMIGGALEFDGIDDCIISGTGLNSAERPFSVVTWIKGATPGQAIISQPGGVDWLAVDAEGNLMTELKGSGRSAASLFSQSLINDDQWHRIGLVWDGSKRMLCVDGVSVAEDIQDSLGFFGSGLYIGVGKNYATGTFFSGLIDDVRIYNRVVSP